MIKFSIIVPVYNAEKYIKNCLDSIINQTYVFYEVIMVADGCEDSSVEICREYVRKDDRFRLYLKSNGGSGSARNFGLKFVSGEYVCFVDSDDVIENNLLESVYNRIKAENADIYIYNYKIVKECGLSVFCPEMKDGVFLYGSSEEKFQLLMNLLYFEYAFSVWNKVYRTQVIREYGVLFPENVRVGEDLNFNMKYFLHCNRISVSNQKLYYYHVRKNSTMEHGEETEPCIDDFVLLLEDTRLYYKKYAPRFIKQHYPVLWYEGMNNQYYKYAHKKNVACIKKMKNKTLYRKREVKVLLSFILFIQYYGIRKGSKIIKNSVRYLIEV